MRETANGKAESRVSVIKVVPLMENMHFDSILAKKLNMFVPLTALELRWLAEIQAKPLKVKRGKQITQQGQMGHRAYVLQAGWACSYKDLPNGSRQIISFPIAGDCVGLRSVLLQTADHSFSALTDAVVTAVEGRHILECVSEYPRLGAAILWAASRDEAMIVEHLVSIGRRSAIERTAHFFMELAERLSLIGLMTGTGFKCPLSQLLLSSVSPIDDRLSVHTILTRILPSKLKRQVEMPSAVLGLKADTQIKSRCACYQASR